MNCENPATIFESLLQICDTLRSQNSHKIPFDAPLLGTNERVSSFLNLLGFTEDDEQSAYVINEIDSVCVDHAYMACQQQLIEISKKSATYNIINTRLRNGSIPPLPPPIEENKSDEYDLSEIDVDGCHLYELIWSTTHPQNTDHEAKEVILLCFCMITSSIKFFKLLEARFFNADNGRTSCSVSTDSSTPPWNSPSPSIPSSLPALPPLALNNTNSSQITFDYEKICSSYCVQKKVTHLILLWMQNYFLEDWHKNEKLSIYFDEFINKATKAYQDDIDFDANERKKGLELIASMTKMLKKQKLYHKYHHHHDDDQQYDDDEFEMNQACFSPRGRRWSTNSGTSNWNSMNQSDPFGVREKKTKKKHKRKLTFGLPSSKSVDAFGINLHEKELLKVPNASICNQIALYLFKKFAAIKPRECLYEYGVRGKQKKDGVNIQKYKDTFNQIVKWVQSSILVQHQCAKRARTIKKWIKITDLLFNIRCFQGFVAVQCALASNAIYSLKAAWNQSNVLKRKHHTKWKEIGVIMSSSHNFENLRRIQREAHAPLIYIQEGVKKRNQDGMINWTKFRRIHEQIKEHLVYQKTPYQRMIKEDISMQTWLETELKRAGTLKTELLDKMSRDIAQKDKSKKEDWA